MDCASLGYYSVISLLFITKHKYVERGRHLPRETTCDQSWEHNWIWGEQPSTQLLPTMRTMESLQKKWWLFHHCFSTHNPQYGDLWTQSLSMVRNTSNKQSKQAQSNRFPGRVPGFPRVCLKAHWLILPISDLIHSISLFWFCHVNDYFSLPP